MALVIAASYNTTLVVKSALGSYLGATDYYTEWSEANENLDAIYREDKKSWGRGCVNSPLRLEV